jgi:GNAT superfamily N-acetyltransferase
MDEASAAGAVSVLEAAREADRPHRPGHILAEFQAWVACGWDGDVPLFALGSEDGKVVALAEMVLPSWDNRHLCLVDLVVDPRARARGVGTALLEAVMERARSTGRSTLVTGSLEHPAPVALAKRFGLTQVSVEQARRQDLDALDREALREALKEASAHSEGYDVERMPRIVPEEMAPDVVALNAAINDAPVDGLDLEDEVFSVARLRVFERTQVALGRRTYRLVARDRSSGRLAGHTVVAISAQQPWHAVQYDTSVVRDHRGHRLGLLLKLTMLGWLEECEPQLRLVDTWNSATNVHMVSVNERVGYRLTETVLDWQGSL